MKRACSRVAGRPTRTISSPVANGSSVPACPTRLTPSSRRTRATMSWDVGPVGLSARTTAPSLARSRVGSAKLGGDSFPEELDELGVRKVGAEAGGAPLPAAAVLAGDRRDVHCAVARAQAHLARPAASVGLVAHDRRGPDALERAHVIDDPLGEVLGGARVLVVGLGDIGEGERAVVVALELLQGAREELHLLHRHAL